MSAGLFALLDDVAALAKLAAASVDDIGAAAGRATAKAAGVVIDDTAVTPQYVHGITADRELPMIKRIAIGSLRNKLLFILPAALLLSQFVPWLLTPILMLGATYLCYEGAEKVWGRLRGHDAHAAPTAAVGEDAEKQMTSGAIRTDFILSAEIMVIALNEVADQPFVPRLIILIVVALVITAAVYGVVALIVKMDDIGLSLAQRSSRFAQKVGRGLVAAMPKLLAALSAIGTVAMLWVGGHILLVGADTLGWHCALRPGPPRRGVRAPRRGGRRRRAGLAGQHRGVGGDRPRRRRGGGRGRGCAAVRQEGHEGRAPARPLTFSLLGAKADRPCCSPKESLCARYSRALSFAGLVGSDTCGGERDQRQGGRGRRGFGEGECPGRSGTTRADRRPDGRRGRSPAGQSMVFTNSYLGPPKARSKRPTRAVSPIPAFIFRLITYFEKLYIDNLLAADEGRWVEPHWQRAFDVAATPMRGGVSRPAPATAGHPEHLARGRRQCGGRQSGPCPLRSPAGDGLGASSPARARVGEAGSEPHAATGRRLHGDGRGLRRATQSRPTSTWPATPDCRCIHAVPAPGMGDAVRVSCGDLIHERAFAWECAEASWPTGGGRRQPLHGAGSGQARRRRDIRAGVDAFAISTRGSPTMDGCGALPRCAVAGGGRFPRTTRNHRADAPSARPLSRALGPGDERAIISTARGDGAAG